MVLGEKVYGSYLLFLQIFVSLKLFENRNLKVFLVSMSVANGSIIGYMAIHKRIYHR